MEKIKVKKLNFHGNIENTIIEVDEFPKKILKVDAWFGPQIGELCFNHQGKIDIVKTIKWGDTQNGLFKSHKIVTFEINTETVSYSMIERIEVKKRKVFIFNGRVFVHQEALDGGYIDELAKGNSIVDYEYEFGE